MRWRHFASNDVTKSLTIGLLRGVFRGKQMIDWKREVTARLANLTLSSHRKAEIIEEVAQHLEDRYREMLSSGAAPENAAAVVMGELRDNPVLANELRQVEPPEPKQKIEPGENRRGNMLQDLIHDIQYGMRVLKKSLGFSMIAVLSIAIGIGAITAVFTVFNTALLRPLPVESPEQIVSLNNISLIGRITMSIPGATTNQSPTFSYPNYKDMRDRNDVFSDLIAYQFTPLSLSHDGINERLWGYEVSGNYFSGLGVEPAAGRLISPEDDVVPGGHPVTVISHRFWQQRFGGDISAVGREVMANGRTYTIIGVAPKGFNGTEAIAAPDLWFPIAMQEQLEIGRKWLNDRGSESLFVQGILNEGIERSQAEASLNVIAEQLEREYPQVNEGKRIGVSDPGMFANVFRGPMLGFTGILLGVVGLFLLLACTNLANLLMARGSDRRREISVRLALGAGRSRLIRQLLTESFLLSCAGGVVGLFIALWLIGLVTGVKMPVDVPVSINLSMDYRVFVFTFVVTLVTGVLFGLLPAWQATKADVVTGLKDDLASTGHRRSWVKNGLIVFQVALSLFLLICGGLMIRALQAAETIDLGFNPNNASEVSFDLRLQGYDDEKGKQFQKVLLERVRALPGVEYAAIADVAPRRSSLFTQSRLR